MWRRDPHTWGLGRKENVKPGSILRADGQQSVSWAYGILRPILTSSQPGRTFLDDFLTHFGEVFGLFPAVQ